MGGTKVLRTALLASGALAATALGAFANAEEAVVSAEAAPASHTINFNDPEALNEGAALDLSIRDDAAARFSPLEAAAANSESPRRVELELAAGSRDGPNVSIAQRASLGSTRDGEVDRQGRGSELRVGRGLVGEREQRGNSTYVFVASDSEALTWQPGSRTEFGSQGSSFALQDRVEIGDLSAGVTWERDGVQTSLAYVEREESTQVGRQTFTQDQSFAGVTVTMRR